MAFATHVTDWRDVTDYADFIEKLGIPTTAFSLGIQDYSAESAAVKSLHPSLLRIFDHVRNTTGYLGVRGFFTASLLYKEGYSNVIPIGCPTMFNGMKRNLKIRKPRKALSVKEMSKQTRRRVILRFIIPLMTLIP